MEKVIKCHEIQLTQKMPKYDLEETKNQNHRNLCRKRIFLAKYALECNLWIIIKRSHSMLKRRV